MALITRTGSLSGVSSQGVPETETVKLTPVGKYAATDKDVDRLHDIEDSYTTLSSVNPDRYPQEYKMLLAYPKGYTMKVSYFHRNQPDIDIRSMPTDISIYADAVHMDFTKIVGLEMKLEEQLQYEERNEDKTVQLSGTAIMFPGFEPYEGDMFFLEADNRNIYLFRIHGITPTTYRQERYYRITFNAYNIVNEELYHKINSWVVDTCYFDKRKYFGESEYTFLNKESYNWLMTLRKLRVSITQDLINLYYSESDETFFRPDGIYDPYVVEYLRRKLAVADFAIRPKQIFPRLKDYYRSVWYKFVDAENTDISDLVSTFIIKRHDPYMYDSDLNGLAMRKYIVLQELSDTEIDYIKSHPEEMYTSGNSGLAHCHCCIDCPICHNTNKTPEIADVHIPYYLFSNAFYIGYKKDMSPLETMIYQYFINADNIDIARFIEYITKYKKIKKSVEGFYTWALYLELVDMCTLRIK